MNLDSKKTAKEALLRCLPFLVFLAAISILSLQKHLMTVCVRYAEKRTPENLPDPRLWLIVPASVAAALASAFPTGLRMRLLTALGATIAVFITGTVGSMFLWGWVLILLGVALWKPISIIRHIPGPREGLFAAALLGLILALGTQLRYDFLINSAFKEDVQADAEFFREISLTQHGYDTLGREPLFPWIGKSVLLLYGSIPAQAMRVLGLALSLISIGVVFEFSRRKIGLLAAVIAALLYSCTTIFVYTAVQGLREDTIISTFVLFIWCCINLWERRPDWAACLFLGATGALISLIRMNNLVIALGGIAVFFVASVYRHKLPRKQWWLAALALAVALGPVAPYLIYSHQKFGDAMHSVNIHARFYANMEFAGRRPDFPTREQFLHNGYEGTPMTMGQYFFGYHTTDEIIKRTISGGLDLCFGKYPLKYVYQMPWQPAWNWGAVFYLPHVLGLIAMLLPGRRIMAAFFFLFTLPSLFLVGTGTLDWRLLTTTFAGFYIGIGAAAATILSYWTIFRGGFAHGPARGRTGRADSGVRSTRRKPRGKK